MNTLKNLQQFGEQLSVKPYTLPAFFIGHGSPMNGIEDNTFSIQWQQLGRDIPTPDAVLVISAHWYTKGTRITAMDHPKTIHDFSGFPQALFNIQYPAPGNAMLAKETAQLIQSTPVLLDHDWGLDHGTWTVVRHIYPDASIPVLQLSIDYTMSPAAHYALAKEIASLRKKGVLILGSGNMVHNLRILNWQQPASGFDWADEMNDTFKKLISTQQHQSLIQYTDLGQAAALAIPTPEHYLPLLYILALQEKNEDATFFNDKTVMGSVSMTSVKISR